MSVTGIDHCTVVTGDVAGTVAFYGDILGLVAGPRPPFDFPGAWLYAGDRAVLHVVGGRGAPLPDRGAIDHVAFAAIGLAEVLARLKTAGAAYRLQRLPGDGPWQLFFRDPNGARIELDFLASEAVEG